MSIRRRLLLVFTATSLTIASGSVAAPAVVGSISAGPEVDCASCLVVADDGSVLWARAPRVRRPIASTTKMATALVVVERADLDAEVQVSGRAAAVPGGRLSLEEGEVFSVRELLFALLLASSNDAAVALAEHVAGSEDAFVDLMHGRVRELGATRTAFTTSHGLDEPGHVSTAEDLARLGGAVLEHPLLAEIVSTARASLTSSTRTVDIENTNELLQGYRGAVGIKTGYTSLAGNVLVAAAERQGRRVLAVAMDSEDAFADSRRLLDHGFAVLRRGVLVRKGDPVGAIVFDPAGAVDVTAARSIRGLPSPGSVRIELRLLDRIVPPLEAGTKVGTVVVRMGDRVVGRTDAVASTHVPVGRSGWVGAALAALVRGCARALPGTTA